MNKIIIFKWECPSCESHIEVTRQLIIDAYTKEINILKPLRCGCGRKRDFKLIDLSIE